MQLDLSVEIDAPVGQVFAFIADVCRSPEWDPNVRDVRIMTRGPIRVGSIIRGTVTAGTETADVDDEVITYESDHRFATRSVQGGDSSIEFTLEKLGAVTHLAVTVRYELPNVPAESIEDANRRHNHIAASIQQSLGQLKNIVEQEAFGSNAVS